MTHRSDADRARRRALYDAAAGIVAPLRTPPRADALPHDAAGDAAPAGGRCSCPPRSPPWSHAAPGSP